MTQPDEPAFAVRIDISLHRRTRYADNFRGLPARDPAVQKPECQHLLANEVIGMALAFLIDDSLLFFCKLDPKPSHRLPPNGATLKQALLAESNLRIAESPKSANVSFRP